MFPRSLTVDRSLRLISDSSRASNYWLVDVGGWSFVSGGGYVCRHIPSGIPVAAVFATEVSFEESTCVPRVPRCVYDMYSLSYMYRFSYLPYIDSLVCESIGKSVSIRTRVDHIRIQHSMSNQQSPNLRVAETGKRFNRTIAIFVIHSYRRSSTKLPRS